MAETNNSKSGTKSKQKKSGNSNSNTSSNKNPPISEAAATKNSSGSNSGDPGQMEKDQLIKIKKAMEMLQLQGAAGAMAGNAAPTSMADAAKKTYEFWSTQPVPKIDEEITGSTNEFIQPAVPDEKLRHEPYSLPSGFKWDTLNLDDPLVLKELYVLLNENYVEDDDNLFRFDYSPEFLRWALMPPGHLKEWHVGCRTTKGKLVGFISGVPANISIYKKVVQMAEINFLCVHKKLRSKRLAPVLIKEITRRVNCEGIFQAVYTAGVILPKPVGSCKYWHRSLNPKKLIEVKFSHLSRNMTMQRHMKLYRLPDDTKTEGMRKLKVEDVPEAYKILNEYLQRFDLSPVFNEEEFLHWFLPREDIIDTFVVETSVKSGDNNTSATSKITDMVSFYTLPSSVMKNPVYNKLKAAYSFYNVSNTVPLVDLMADALVLAKKADFDVFNALDLMDNEDFLEKLKFGIGDGNLQYYFYNWRCAPMQPKSIGLVLQ